MTQLTEYIAFLRGINVGGNHKLPMADLKKEVVKLGFEKPDTLLNSGNLVFQGPSLPEEALEQQLAEHLKKVFGFPVPVLIRNSEELIGLLQDNPFRDIEVTKDTRLYLSFLKEEPQAELALPWSSEDQTFTILEIRGRTVCSVLDVSLSPTPKGMDALEQLFGKNITTRNWNTLERIGKKWLDAS